VIVIDALLLYRFFSAHDEPEGGSPGFVSPDVADRTSTVPYP